MSAIKQWLDKANSWISSQGGFLRGLFHSLGVPDLIKGFTGSGLTGAEQEQNAFNSNESAISRQFNSDEAEKQRQYETVMSNTSYQRAVADMQAAGINPALAMNQGGSVTPSGSSASSSPASGTAGNHMVSMSDIMAAIQMKKQNAVLDAQADELRAKARESRASAAATEIDNLTRDQLNRSQLVINGVTVDNIKSDTVIKEIEANFKPDLLAQQLESGRVEINLLSAQIAKVYQEIDNLTADEKLTYQNIINSQLLPALYASEVALNNAKASESGENANYINSKTYQQDLDNEYQRRTGAKSGSSYGAQVMNVVNKAALNLRDYLKKPTYFGSGSNPYYDGLRHEDHR